MPKDDYNFVYWTCLLLGCGTLLSYNLLITCADYFDDMFPDHPDIMFYIVPSSACPQLLFQILMIRYGHTFPFTSRIVSSFILSSIALAALPIFVHQFSETIAFWIVLSVSAFIGVATAINQTSIVGFCNFLPSSYIQLSFGGQATSGIVSCIIRIITKIYHIYGGITAGQSGIVYFVTGSLFNIICAIAFVFVFKSRFTQYQLEKETEYELSDPLVRTEIRIPNDVSHNVSMGGAVPSVNGIPKYEPPQVSYKTVFNKIWKIALSVFLVFYITLLSYPGLLVGIDSQYSVIQNNGWMPVILTTEYNVGDWIGRQFVVSLFNNIKWNQNSLWKACIIRLIIYPLFIILFLGYLQYDIIVYVATAILSLSNGYFCCICFIQAPQLVKKHEQQVCGAIMSFSLVLGITLGSYSALAVSPFI